MLIYPNSLKKEHNNFYFGKTESIPVDFSARLRYNLNPVLDFKRSLKHRKKNNQLIGLDLNIKTGS